MEDGGGLLAYNLIYVNIIIIIYFVISLPFFLLIVSIIMSYNIYITCTF